MFMQSWEFPNLSVSTLVVCIFYAEVLFCALLRSLLRLRSFACFCVRLRSTAFGNCSCEGFIRHRPPRPRPRIRHALLRGRFGIELGSNQEIDVESMPNRPLRREGEADSRVRSGIEAQHGYFSYDISRDACSASIAKLFRARSCGVSHNYRAICCRMGYRTDAPVWNQVQRGGGYRTVLGDC